MFFLVGLDKNGLQKLDRKMLSHQQGILIINSPANHKNSIFPIWP